MQQNVSLILSIMALAGMVGFVWVTHFKITLMWAEYSKRHGLDGSGEYSCIYACGTARGMEVMKKMQGKT